MKILVLNGPNLATLGKRQPEIYGKTTLEDIVSLMRKRAAEMKVELDVFQSNEEGALVSKIGQTAGVYDGLIFNPAAYTHTSVALRDALLACEVPCVEVHLSNIHAREEFRQKSMTAGVCVGQISGFGVDSYLLALDAMVRHLGRKKK
jgi:3-dehydroquinate dehydratase II